jgi:hypothetical protein
VMDLKEEMTNMEKKFTYFMYWKSNCRILNECIYELTLNLQRF